MPGVTCWQPNPFLKGEVAIVRRKENWALALIHLEQIPTIFVELERPDVHTGTRSRHVPLA